MSPSSASRAAPRLCSRRAGPTGVAWVEHRGSLTPTELIGPADVRDVFTAAEIRHCGRSLGLTRWAGRLAAKWAVIAAVGDPRWALLDVEIVPERRACYDPARCARGHPPGVRLSSAAAADLPKDVGFALSISHTDRAAVAVAIVHSHARTPGTSMQDGRR